MIQYNTYIDIYKLHFLRLNFVVFHIPFFFPSFFPLRSELIRIIKIKTYRTYVGYAVLAKAMEFIQAVSKGGEAKDWNRRTFQRYSIING